MESFRCLHILNPNKSNRPFVVQFFKKNPQKKHFWVERSSHPFHLETLVDWAILNNYPTIAVWGGDGSFNRVVQALVDHDALDKISVCLVPAGTGNDFARQFEVQLDERKLSKLFLNDHSVIHRDIGVLSYRSKQRIFMNNAGFGRSLESLQVDKPNPVKDIFRFQKKKIDIRWMENDRPFHINKDILFGIIFNAPYFNRGLYFDSSYSSRDELLSSVFVPDQLKWRLLLKFFMGRMGYPLLSAKDITVTSKTIHVQSDELLYPQVDGERIDREGVYQLSFSLYPQKLNMVGL